MPAATSLLAASAAVGGGSSLLSAYQQSQALKAQAQYTKDQNDTNARLADMQADDAIRRGNTEANKAVRQGDQMVSEQRAASAAQGIDINTGSAGDIQTETTALSQQDAEIMKNNAWREAWGFKTQAIDARNQGNLALVAGNNAARNTMLTGGLQALSQFGQAAGYAAKGAKTGATSSTSSRDSSTPMSDEFQAPTFGSSLTRRPRNYSL